jgi:cation:H+ antiporter
VGSNIFNIAVILGIAALLAPLAVAETALRRDAVLVIATAALFSSVGWLWMLDRATGAIFLVLLAAYLVFAVRQERMAGGTTAAGGKEAALVAADPATAPATAARGWAVPALLVLAGLAMLVGGGRFFVTGSIDLARILGVSEAVIGLTIVAAGTSMPELATSILAAFRRQADVALGNVLGSNIYNTLGIGGVTALIAPTEMPAQIVSFDNLVMIGLSVALLGLLYTGRTLSRAEGGLLLAAYSGYAWWLWP